MRYDVATTELAIADLQRLAAFLFGINPNAASKAIDAILEAIESLSEIPGRGRLSDEGDLRELVVRFGAHGYVIQYHLDGSQVLVLRIFHEREDR